MKRILALLIACSLLALMVGCQAAENANEAAPTVQESASQAQPSASEQESSEAPAASSDEHYALVSCLTTFPMYVNHDQASFKAWGEKMGVKVSINGPADFDIATYASAIEQVAAQKPTGMMLIGHDPTLDVIINKVTDMGIPVVMYDADVPNSKRLAFVGTDWEKIGRLQGEEMARQINGKGKVAYMGIVGASEMEKAFVAYEKVLKEYPEIEILGKYDDTASVEKATQITADLLRAHPDIAGISGFDAMSGPGIGLAVKEAGQTGKVKVTCVDWEPEHLALVQEGVIQKLIGQKRELFTYYAAQILYDYVHKANSLSKDDATAGVTSIPFYIDTGLIEITKDNVDLFVK